MGKFIAEFDYNGFKKYQEFSWTYPERIYKIAVLNHRSSLARAQPPSERWVDGYRYRLDEPALVNYQTMVFRLVRDRRKDMNTVELYYEFEKWE